MATALNMLNDFGDHYYEFAPQVGYTVHWGIMAPCSFVKKQKGTVSKINYLFPYGTTQVGKSTAAYSICFIWDRDLDEQVISGTHVHSTYQFAKAISQSTFPTIIDEGENLFEDKKLLSMLKTTPHSTSARARFNNYLQRDEEVMALSPCIITSNHNKPNDGAVGARLDLIKFISSETRSTEEKKAFDDKFKPKDSKRTITRAKVHRQLRCNQNN